MTVEAAIPMIAEPPVSKVRAEPDRAHACPRCGYDQAGAIASWHDSCPLIGTCSECGLTFEWRRLYAGEGLAPEWSFEHGELTFHRFVGTVLRGMLPWLLWRGVPIECPVRPWRLVLLVLAFLPLVHVMVSSAVLTIDPPSGSKFGTSPAAQVIAENIEAAVMPYFLTVRRVPMFAPLAWLMLFAMFMPLSTLILGESLKRCRVRSIHLIRGYGWSWTSGAPLAFVMTIGALSIASLVTAGRISWGAQERMAYFLIFAAFPAWLWAWWYGFMKRYLRLPNAFWVASLLLIVSFLASTTALWLASEVFNRLTAKS